MYHQESLIDGGGGNGSNSSRLKPVLMREKVQRCSHNREISGQSAAACGTGSFCVWLVAGWGGSREHGGRSGREQKAEQEIRQRRKGLERHSRRVWGLLYGSGIARQVGAMGQCKKPFPDPADLEDYQPA